MANNDTKTTLRLEIISTPRLPEPDLTKFPTLTVLTGADFGEFFVINESSLILGRSTQADIRIDDASISRQHARIVCQGALVFIEDLGSANGTQVNGTLITERTAIADGDKLTLGKMVTLRFSYQDSTDEAFQRRLFDAALRDGLTRAYNKRYLLERLGTELSFARRHEAPLSLVIFDLDHFKDINDTYGHPVGDCVLVELTRRVLALVRDEDILGRYGGDEFILICRGINREGSIVVAERLQRAIRSTEFVSEGRRIPVSLSIGVATYPVVDAPTSEHLIKAADLALYEAKRAGRDRISIYGE